MSEIPTVKELRDQARALPYGPARVALLEAAVAQADAGGDLDEQYDARQDLVTAATFSGRDDLMLVHYTWSLAAHDRHPGRFDTAELLWKYKWVVGNAANFPDISRVQIEELFDDMERRFRAFGSNLQPVYLQRQSVYAALGDADRAEAAHRVFQRLPREMLSDCAACEAGELSDYESDCGRFEAALAAAEPVTAGRLHCTHEPHRTIARVLWPLLNLGRAGEAKWLQRKGYGLIKDNAPEFVQHIAKHVVYLALTKSLDRAKEIFERHAADCLGGVDLLGRLSYLRAGALLGYALEATGRADVRFRTAPTAVGGDGTARGTRVWCLAEGRKIADRFDARNGNRHVGSTLDDLPGVLAKFRS